MIRYRTLSSQRSRSHLSQRTLLDRRVNVVRICLHYCVLTRAIKNLLDWHFIDTSTTGNSCINTESVRSDIDSVSENLLYSSAAYALL